MSARYIARKYGGGDCSPERPGSRALSRPPSSRGASVLPSSRGASPTPSYYRDYAGGCSSSRESSRANTPIRGQSEYRRSPTPDLREYRRSPTPLRTTYSETLCTASRRLRERSIPPPEPLPERIQPVRVPGKPPPSARVVASDFYRGRVKSIYEREPLFADFCHTIPQRYGQINIYNTGTLDTLKTDFKSMVEDKWRRMACRDPSVEMNFGAKVYPWRDLAVKEREPASARIFRAHEARGARATTPVNMPRVYVYHRSTMSPAPR